MTDSTDPEKLQRMSASFFPFGGGTRQCPGMTLALMEATLAIGFLSLSFDMELACPVEEIERISTFVATSNKMPVYLKPIIVC